jgi:pyrroline-5-carboxylate reductase
MGSALARAAAKSGVWDTILLSNRSRAKAERLSAGIGGVVTDNAGAAAEADYLLLGVEPAEIPALIAQLRAALDARERKAVVVSMAAGVELSALRGYLGEGAAVIRIMPNIPAAVGEGVILYAAAETVTEEQKQLFLSGMAAAGTFVPMDESRMKAATGVTGCGPAYAALFAEALADGAVACGLPRKQAVSYSAQMLLGSARLLLESGAHPGELKDRVCSPAGSTIQGVRVLEERAFRAAVTDAVIATYEKKF